MTIAAAIPKAEEEPAEAERARALVRRIAEGEATAEAELVATFSRGLLFFLKRQGLLPEQADDLHQETFRIALERLRGRGLDDPAALGAFLRGVALQLLRADWRKNQRRKTEADEAALEVAADARPGALPKLLEHERARLVRETIRELPVERDRRLLYRFYVAEESREAICNDLGLDALHFHRVLFRARQRFKELYERSASGAGPS